MKYIHLPTKKQADELPKSIGNFVSEKPLPLEICAKWGWRLMPKDAPVASSADNVITSISYVQAADPLKVIAVTTEAKAASDAEAARVAERDAWINGIVDAFKADEKQAIAIRTLAERVRQW